MSPTPSVLWLRCISTGIRPPSPLIDGVDQPAGSQVTRDVFDIAPAQRLDLRLRTQNNGLDSYGPGLWMFHDHVPTGTTTDGMEPGGNMAILAYKPLLDEQGMPKMHDALLDQVFNKDYYAKKQAVWGEGDFAPLLGEAGLIAARLCSNHHFWLGGRFSHRAVYFCGAGLQTETKAMKFLVTLLLTLGLHAHPALADETMAMMHHGSMMMDEKGMIMNANSDNLPEGLPEDFRRCEYHHPRRPETRAEIPRQNVRFRQPGMGC